MLINHTKVASNMSIADQREKSLHQLGKSCMSMAAMHVCSALLWTPLVSAHTGGQTISCKVYSSLQKACRKHVVSSSELQKARAGSHLGQHRVLGYIPDDGGHFKRCPAAVSAQAASKVKAKAIYMVLLYPPEYMLPFEHWQQRGSSKAG